MHLLLHGRVLWALSLGLFWHAFSCDHFILHYFAAEISMSSFAGVFSFALFCRDFLRYVFRRTSSAWIWQGFYHGFFPGDILQDLFCMENFHGLFHGAFFAVVVSVSAFAGFFACLLSQSFFRGFSRDFFPWDIFRALLCVVNFHAFFRRASSACTFATILSGISLRVVLRELFRMDNFHGFFREGFSPALLYSGYLRALFCGGWYQGFFLQWLLLCNFLRVISRGTFLGDIFRELLRMDDFQAVFFAGAFSVLSLARLFPRALFRNGGIHWLITRSFLLAILCIDILRALFWRVFLRARFLGLFLVRFFAFCGCPIAGVFAVRFCAGVSFRVLLREAFLARSFAGPFPWDFSERIFRASLRQDGFYGLISRVVFSALSRGILFGTFFSGASSVHLFAFLVSMGSFARAFPVLSFTVSL